MISRVRLIGQGGLAAFTLGFWLTVGSAFAQYVPPQDFDTFPPAHTRNFFIETDCGSGSLTTAGAGDFISSVSGTSATITAPTTSSTGSAGLCQFNTGTTTTGRAAVMIGNNGSVAALPGPLDFALGTTKFLAVFDEGTASTAGETYTLRVGFIDSASTVPVDGCYFRYTHGTNSGKWQIVTISNTSETAADSGITFVATTRRQFGIVATGGTSCAFYSSGVQVTNSPIATTVPTGGTRTVSAGAFVLKSAGSTDTVPMYLDYMAVLQIPTTARAWVPF